MFLLMGITGSVGGATAQYLLAQGRKVRALVRYREQAANWVDQGVELVNGDWDDATAVERALKGAKVHLSCCRLSGHTRLISEKQRTRLRTMSKR
ncbi:SDR family oxidoreductase [Paraburkholderia sp. J8-2]|uniref:SDR family oxidoreductase n=1 Tax=Paraburkholderia sp. J8-2 TaxID=2805440 RepID=UPI002AB78457|nr:NAD(P)H-binding protein [Paraburkholderia sp. J8-2]